MSLGRGHSHDFNHANALGSIIQCIRHTREFILQCSFKPARTTEDFKCETAAVIVCQRVQVLLKVYLLYQHLYQLPP